MTKTKLCKNPKIDFERFVYFIRIRAGVSSNQIICVVHVKSMSSQSQFVSYSNERFKYIIVAFKIN